MYQQRVDELEMQIRRGVERTLVEKKMKLERLTAALSALDPEKLLERGYALVFDPASGLPVTTSKIPSGTDLTLRFADGSLPVKTLSSR